LTGWTCRPENAIGTVFLMHGFRENSYNLYLVEAAERYVQLNLAVVAFDFRHHGKSEKRLPTFGFAECLDITGAMNWAEHEGYPKPFILHAGSLGGLAAQVCAIRDPRVAGAFLKSVPASASVALANSIRGMGIDFELPGQRAALTEAINATYEYDVIHWGNVMSYNGTPVHRPRVFYAIGQYEEYGYDATKATFNHWYPGEEVVCEVPPAAAWGQHKWFRTAWDGLHAFGVAHYPTMHTDVNEFFQLLCSDYSAKTPLGSSTKT
jgi:pimeloyl-ACP methyl ester carboxylesterase